MGGFECVNLRLTNIFHIRRLQNKVCRIILVHMWRVLSILYIILSLLWHFMEGSYRSLLMAMPSFFILILLLGKASFASKPTLKKD